MRSRSSFRGDDDKEKGQVPDVEYFSLRRYLLETGIATLDVSVIAAFWYAGEIPNERMPTIAAELLERGLNSPHLGFIAGMQNPKLTHPDIDEDLNRAFRELGIDAPISVSTARLIAACHLAREVIDGRLDAARGASVITQLFRWDDQSPAAQIVRIHSDLVEWVRRDSSEEAAAKANVVTACRDFLMANGEPTQK
jgi:hypothetical protein